MTPQERRQPITHQRTRQPVNRRMIEKKIGTDTQDQVARKNPQVPQTTLKPPPKKSTMKRSKVNPSRAERGTLRKRACRSAPTLKVSIPDTAENPERANIQGVVLSQDPDKP